MSSLTGFRAYHIYCTVKNIFFRSKKYDIMTMPLPKRDVFIKKWNDEIVNRRDSMLFYKLDKLFETDENALKRLYCFYWLENPKFWISDVFDNGMATWKGYEGELNAIRDVLERDLYAICAIAAGNNVGLRHMFDSRGRVPLVFRAYDLGKISVHGLLGFHYAMGIGEWQSVTARNVVEEEKLKKYRAIIDKYSKLVHKYYDFDVKGFLRHCYKGIVG